MAQPESPPRAEAFLGLGALQVFQKLSRDLGAETSVYISCYFTGDCDLLFFASTSSPLTFLPSCFSLQKSLNLPKR